MTIAVRDDFDRVLTEKLWTLVPHVYRDLDGEGPNLGALRALIELIATEAAHLRRSHDRLWDDQMIETCADWAVPYIGALIGTRVLPKDAGRGARIDVAKSIYYRKRKGTPAILEQLIADITGWEGTVVEGFRRLARSPHPHDAPRDAMAWEAMAPMADALETERVGGPFDQMQHLPDIATPVGKTGRHGINRVALHLYRQMAVGLQGIWPRAQGVVADAYTFDPSGRDVPLFAERGRSGAMGDSLDWDGWRPAQPWDLPAPIPCRLLGQEAYIIGIPTQTRLLADGLAAAVVDELLPLFGRRLKGLAGLRTALLTRPSAATFLNAGRLTAIRETALVDDCGKAQLLPRSIRVEVNGNPVMPLTQISAGSLADWADPRVVSGLVIDPERGRFRLPGGTPAGRLTTDHFTGHAMALGAGGFARMGDLPAPQRSRAGGAAIDAAALITGGALRLMDNATWGQPVNRTGIVNLNIHAAPGRRPYIRLTGPWTLTATAAGNAFLTLDGLWIGAGVATELRLAGDWEEVRLRNITLDPGGPLTDDAGAMQLPPVILRVMGRVETLVIENSILSRVALGPQGQVETLRMADSVAQHPDALAPLPDANIILDRCTVLGRLSGRRIDVSNSLIAGQVAPRDVQAGCFRFSAAAEGSSRPKPYRSALIAPGTVLFKSRRLGNPGYTRLRDHAPDAIRLGGEGDAEMGAFHALNDAARLRGLRQKVSEYAPFGILPIMTFET
jgi:hypothetical protein